MTARAIERGIYSDGEMLEIRVYHAAWAVTRPITRVPVTHLQDARRCVDDIKAASVHEVEEKVTFWRAMARDWCEAADKQHKAAMEATEEAKGREKWAEEMAKTAWEQVDTAMLELRKGE
jgi:hypothetical protein